MKVMKLSIFTAACILLLYINNYTGGVNAQRIKAPGIKILRTIDGGISRFEPIKIHPSRFILSKINRRPFSPVIYDIENNRLIKLPPPEKISGLPVEPYIRRGKNYRTRKMRMILEGNYWKWNRKRIVYYNPESGRAGIYLEKSGKEKFIPGNPPCSGCGEVSKFVEKYQRYYCYGCRKYVKIKEYIRDVYKEFYAVMETESNSIDKLIRLDTGGYLPDEKHGISPIGVDPEGKYFYYSNRIFFYKSKKTTGHIILYRLNIQKGRVDWKYEIRMPVRYKGKAAGAYSVRYFASEDLSRILFWEYDEKKSDPFKGWLRNPTARGYVVDTGTKSHFEIDVPLTAYGRLFDRENRYLLLGSNQTGYIHRINLRNRSEDKKVKSYYSIFFMMLSPGSKYLYIFNKFNVEVREWPSLKYVKRLALSSIFPGITTLLVSENMISLNKGKYAVIGVLKKGSNGPWASSDLNRGFHLLQIGD